MQTSPKMDTPQSLRQDVLNLGYPYLLTTLPLLLFAAGILFFKFDFQINHLHLVLWFEAIFLVIVCQTILAICYHLTKSHTHWKRFYFPFQLVNAAVVGVMWGLSAALFMPGHALLNLFLGMAGYWALLLAVNYFSPQAQTPGVTSMPSETDTLPGVDALDVLNIKFEQSRAYARRHQQGLAVFSIDVMNYAEVKTKLGEDAGRLLIKTVATRLQYCKRESDILSRTAEHRFVLVLTDVLLGNDIRAVTNRIFRILAENTVIEGEKLQIKLDIGVSLFPHDGENLVELIRKSEVALQYLAENGRSPFYRLQIYDQEETRLEKNER